MADEKRNWGKIVSKEFEKQSKLRRKKSRLFEFDKDVDERREEIVKGYLTDTMSCIQNIIKNDIDTIKIIVNDMIQVHDERKKLIIIGNGGSAAIASHMAADFSKAYLGELKGLMKFQALCLTDNISAFTAWTNDAGYENVFTAQLKGMLDPGDMVIAISGSGTSKNIIQAIKYANSVGAVTVGFTGLAGPNKDGGELAKISDAVFIVPDTSYKRIEDMHVLLGHLIKSVFVHEISARKNKAVFFDRDGVLNLKAKPGDYITDIKDLKLMPEIQSVVARLNDKGYKVIVITNQQCIGKNILTKEKLDDIHKVLNTKLHEHGAYIDAYYYCPHLIEDKCSCRKPREGMILKAAKDFDIDLSKSYFVGDSDTDMVAAKRAGCKPIHFTKQLAKNPYKLFDVIL